ncbi:MAG: SGNH/GDSL hydrolase family protein [Clostridia bacterium]|nr:SGNH/GDSL hydrolase family protein [Clostridia bacterium]
MKALNFKEIKSLVHGASRVEEGDGVISFFRFTKEQQELYWATSRDFYNKTFATAGISLEFDTNSQNLELSVLVSKGSSRSYFTHSIFVDGVRIGDLSGNIRDGENRSFEKSFGLGTGLKRVKILFPWSVYSRLKSLKLDDNAKVLPIEKTLKMIMFGDSITQGYDASSPELTYASTLSTALGAEAINKGIAGEQFFAGFGKTKDDFAPDLITVAYGTNDWRHAKKEKFLASCKGFFQNVRNNYPAVKIVAITPLWRVDIDNEQEFGEPLSFVGNYIKEIAKTVPNMVVIDGTNLIEHAPEFFQTDGVHPIDAGFEQYSKNLKACEVFKKYIG